MACGNSRLGISFQYSTDVPVIGSAYERQFGVSGPHKFDFGASSTPPPLVIMMSRVTHTGASLKERYRQRLRDPSAGDRVEVTTLS